jgi:hypothetical protein
MATLSETSLFNEIASNIYPSWLIVEYARMRFILFSASAEEAATIMVALLRKIAKLKNAVVRIKVAPASLAKT